jgi:type IV pilus assembly protein PilA
MFMLMALKRNEKGLTLIELLAVLVIVAIIAAIAIPAIGGTITKSKARADEASLKVIEEASIRYLVDNQGSVPKINTVNYATLVSEGYLNKKIEFNNGSQKVNIAVTEVNNGTWSVVVTQLEGTTQDQPS